ncbi:MAG TPA: hypothetical protein VMU54_11295 [Planctomycetota bacterium]|nr:hypothetical protein [Planctomycetota bacterium]
MEDTEGGVDKLDVLREVAGAIPMDEAPLPDLPPPEPEAVAPEPEIPLQVTPARSTPRPSWWSVHRHEMAGLVTAFVSFVWVSLGIATRAWTPSLIGVTFALGALLIGSQAVWSGD